MPSNHTAPHGATQPTGQGSPGRADALAWLDARGAHFVLAREDKRPAWKAWQHSKPKLRDALLWPHLVGAIPGSLGMAVVDVDKGGDGAVEDVAALLGEPVARVPSKRPGGAHLWYRTDGAAPNRIWSTERGSGDVRGSGGFAILWDPAALVEQARVRYGDAQPVALATLHGATGGGPSGLDAVRNAAEGERNTVLNAQVFAAAAKAPLSAGDVAQYRAAALEAGLDAEEVERTLSSATEAGDEDRRKAQSAWWQIGARCADRLRSRFRFDAERRCWHEWRDGNRWEEATDATVLLDALHYDRLRIAADLGEAGRADLAQALSNSREWRIATGGQSSEWWGSLRYSLARRPLAPPPWEFATPGGVVDTRDGSVAPHDSQRHDTTAVSRGRYRPDVATALDEALWRTLSQNMSRPDYLQLTNALGVAVARRNLDYGGLLWLYGASGGGKSFTANLILEALGSNAAGASAGLVGKRDFSSDIDADLAGLLERDPAVIVASEVKRITSDRLNGLTGGDLFSARRPHGRIIRKKLTGTLLCTSVDAPRVELQTGLARRLIVIEFPEAVRVGNARTRAYSADELDAVVTLAALWAGRVGRADWTPPTGNVAAKARFEQEADPVAAWLAALPHSAHGELVRDTLATCNDDLGNTGRAEVSQTLFGRILNVHPIWGKRLRRSDRRMVLELRHPKTCMGTRV